MTPLNQNLNDDIVLKEDLYKNNILLLKKGSIINNHILQKLNKFGVYPKNNNLATNFINSINCSKEVLIIQPDNFNAARTENILKFAGFNPEKILKLNSTENLIQKIGRNKISYIFIDKTLFSEDFVNDTLLLKNTNKIKIFVLNCSENDGKNITYNTDFQDIKFLYKPLANNYIKALLRLYS